MEEINIIISKIEDNLGECYSYQNGDDVDLKKDLIKDLKKQLILSGVVNPLKDKKAISFEEWNEQFREFRSNEIYYYRGSEYNLNEIRQSYDEDYLTNL